MTSTVIIEAHCADTKQVLIQITGQPGMLLNDGEKTTKYFFDDIAVTVKEVLKEVPRSPKAAPRLPAHQQRVVDEKAELDERMGKLGAFFASPTFAGLDEAEQERLRTQHATMQDYSSILGDRIAAFPAQGA